MLFYACRYRKTAAHPRVRPSGQAQGLTRGHAFARHALYAYGVFLFFRDAASPDDYIRGYDHDDPNDPRRLLPA
ncbi:hypothetical protein MES5069_170066 [Mesorhizobium escarrei]|uniref:Uncharacterized protein n=1 Tax=Mesorhizobium escarrei TaxID=666018 RepID=A0ABM9DMW8_9HYPH|nr:hypothetical protein MES5069_170066 [Mesorhizobium escarrei]